MLRVDVYLHGGSRVSFDPDPGDSEEARWRLAAQLEVDLENKTPLRGLMYNGRAEAVIPAESVLYVAVVSEET